jgi:hypothetical protein
MATPSLQDVLCAVPALAVQIDAMTELSPGVASSPANVKELLRYLVDAGVYKPEWLASGAAVGVRFKTRRGKVGTIHVQLCTTQLALERGTQHLGQGTFPCTEDGLLKALGFAKDIVRRLREHGLCACSFGNVYQCHIKLPGMPRCGRCQMSASLAI